MPANPELNRKLAADPGGRGLFTLIVDSSAEREWNSPTAATLWDFEDLKKPGRGREAR